jgi:hypothetical protein
MHIILAIFLRILFPLIGKILHTCRFRNEMAMNLQIGSEDSSCPGGAG